MSLTLHFHPLASFCWKALIGLYELEVPFEKHIVTTFLRSPTSRAAFARLWPIAKFPVLRDEARGRTVPESTVILEYVDGTTPGRARSDPRGSGARPRVRPPAIASYDLYVAPPHAQKIGDRPAPSARVEAMRSALEQGARSPETAYALVDEQLREGPWAAGSDFTLADCSAMPAVFYASKVAPFEGRWKHLQAYSERLYQRPSVKRVLEEAQPYFDSFPG